MSTFLNDHLERIGYPMWRCEINGISVRVWDNTKIAGLPTISFAAFVEIDGGMLRSGNDRDILMLHFDGPDKFRMDIEAAIEVVRQAFAESLDKGRE